MFSPTRVSGGRIFLAILSLFIAGCASVDVRRVHDDDYTTHGFRFYRPRPYIVVNKPFPIGGDDFFVYGLIDSKNRVVAIDASQLPEPVKTHFIGISQYKVNIPFAAISDSPQLHDQQGLKPGGQSKKSSPPANGTTPPANGTTPAPKSGATSQPSSKQTTSASATQPTTQESTLRTTSDPTADPYEKLNDYLGILYVPDFDQQYAVNLSAGLGTASASLQMKNGWMTENASWNVDNRQLGQFVFSNITKFVDLATTVAEQAIAPGSAELAGLASAASSKSAQQGEEAPTTVLLRIRYVLQASPGTYPILKPGEMHANCENLAAKHHVLLPLPPYTVVAYNYSASVAVELISISTQTSSTKPAEPDDIIPGAPQGVGDADAIVIRKWLAANPIQGLNVDTNIPFGLTSDGMLIVNVTGAVPGDVDAKLDAALMKNPLTLSNNVNVKSITIKHAS